LCLFICASTRAVHLEIVPNLKEQLFLLAFWRFVSRRSLSRVMNFDNATTYKYAVDEISTLFQSNSLQRKLSMYIEPKGDSYHIECLGSEDFGRDS